MGKIITSTKNPRLVLHEDHKRPASRREFIASGLMGFSAFMMAPSILSILGKPSFANALSAEACAASSATPLPAFVGINLGGGASLSGNYLPLDAGGNLLPKYDILGLGTGTPTIENEFQGVKFAGVSNGTLTSQFLAGLRSTTSQATRDKSSFVGVCVPLQDDTNSNQIDPTGMVTAAGLVGDLLPKLGTSNSETGIDQKPSKITPPAPLIVTKLEDLTSALSPASTLTKQLDVNQRRKLLTLVSSLSGSQARAVASTNSSSSATLSKLVQCATDKNIELATATNPGIDPMLDSNLSLANLWQMNTGGNLFGRNGNQAFSQNQRKIFGSMVYNALKGNSGSIGLELGGYDYHGQGRQNQDDKDFMAGALVGKVLESGAVMNKKVFIHVTSDGSVGAPSSTEVRVGFESDRGSGGMAYILAFDPAGRPKMKNDRAGSYQIGNYTNGQGASDDTLSGSAERAGLACFANYLAFAGQSSLLDKVLSRPYTTSEQDYVVRFA